MSSSKKKNKAQPAKKKPSSQSIKATARPAVAVSNTKFSPRLLSDEAIKKEFQSRFGKSIPKLRAYVPPRPTPPHHDTLEVPVEPQRYADGLRCIGLVDGNPLSIIKMSDVMRMISDTGVQADSCYILNPEVVGDEDGNIITRFFGASVVIGAPSYHSHHSGNLYLYVRDAHVENPYYEDCMGSYKDDLDNYQYELTERVQEQIDYQNKLADWEAQYGIAPTQVSIHGTGNN